MAEVPESKVLNIAGYAFFQIDDADSWEDWFRSRCQQLLGTVTLAPEGLNLSLAGPERPLRSLIAAMQERPELEALSLRESFSRAIPFGQFKIRRKTQIIPFPEGVSPAMKRAETITPQALQAECKSNPNLLILDVRNEVEVQAGRFKGSESLGLNRFGDLPAKIRALPLETLRKLQTRDVVTVCTGGIKTEKAALWMRENGFPKVRLLETGILGYLQTCGDAHFEGRCFVFDERTSLNGQLREGD